MCIRDRFNLDEAKVTAGILIIYVLSAFAGGFVIGKITGTKKFFWGLLVGIFYAVLLVLVSFGLYRSIQGSVSELVTTFLAVSYTHLDVYKRQLMCAYSDRKVRKDRLSSLYSPLFPVS